MARDRMEVTIQDAKILWPNFSGRPTKFKPEGGEKTFVVVLDQKLAEDMKADGWNVRFPEDPVDEDEEQTKDPIISVKLGYSPKARPPKVVLITSNGAQYLTKDMVEILDSMDFTNVDLKFNSSNWEFGGKSGIKAYLKSMYLTMDEDELDRKYAHLLGGDEDRGD